MKTKVAAWAFFLTFLLTTILGISQISSVKNSIPSPDQQAMKKTTEIPTKAIPTLKTLP